MAYGITVLILVLAMACSALSLHPRFRFWLPTFDYQLEAGNSPTIIFANEGRPSDRPTVRRYYGTADRDGPPGPPLRAAPADTRAALHADVDTDLAQILHIRTMLGNMARSLKQSGIGTPPDSV